MGERPGEAPRPADDGAPETPREPEQAAPPSVPPGWSANQPPAWTPPQPSDWTTPTPPPAQATEPSGTWPGQPGSRLAGADPRRWQQSWGPQGRWQPDVKPGVIPLRPLGVGEILDGAISTIRQHPRVMLGISAIVGAISALLNSFASWLTLRDLEGIDPETATDEEVVEFLAIGFTSIGATIVVTTLATLVATGVLTVAISRAVLGRRVSMREAWESARPRLVRLVGLWLLTSLIIFGVVAVGPVLGILLAAAGVTALGVAVAVIGGIGGALMAIYFYVRFALAPPALILEKQRIVAAMRRSHRLVKGSWWRVFGILLLALVLAGILGQIIQTPFGLLGFGTSYFVPTEDFTAPGLVDLTVAGIGGVVASAITLPFTAGVTTLLYVDQRMRREALDIELARTAASAPTAAATTATQDGPTGRPTG